LDIKLIILVYSLKGLFLLSTEQTASLGISMINYIYLFMFVLLEISYKSIFSYDVFCLKISKSPQCSRVVQTTVKSFFLFWSYFMSE